jgi:hypothetical protein
LSFGQTRIVQAPRHPVLAQRSGAVDAKHLLVLYKDGLAFFVAPWPMLGYTCPSIDRVNQEDIHDSLPAASICPMPRRLAGCVRQFAFIQSR